MSHGSAFEYGATNLEARLAAHAIASERAAFIRNTYYHLAGAIGAFCALTALLINAVPGETMVSIFTAAGSWTPLVLIGLFIGASMLAKRWASADMPIGMQYVGLGLYVVAESLICWPLLWICSNVPQFEGIIPQAGILTLAMVGGLTAATFITRQDFSFLGPVITIGSFLALGVILAGLLFSFKLGLFFSFGMVALASAAILYQTSNVLHHYRTDQYVGAALALFASIATLFWYVIRILMQSRE